MKGCTVQSRYKGGCNVPCKVVLYSQGIKEGAMCHVRVYCTVKVYRGCIVPCKGVPYSQGIKEGAMCHVRVYCTVKV